METLLSTETKSTHSHIPADGNIQVKSLTLWRTELFLSDSKPCFKFFPNTSDSKPAEARGAAPSARLWRHNVASARFRACEQDQDGTAVPSWSCSQAVSKPVWHTPFLCVQWKTPDDGQRNCPKHVEFYFKNKFEKLEHVVGFIIRIDEKQLQNLEYFKLFW